jgi:hypothetical protein
VCIVLADALLERFGGDTVRQVREHFDATTGRTRDRLRTTKTTK